ncbi:MAG: hypothetical protein WAZ27_05150 [Minisyncoccia bacterium]
MSEKLTTKEIDAMIRREQYGDASKPMIVFGHIVGGVITVAVIGALFKVIQWIF